VIFFYYKTKSQATWSRERSGKFAKQSPHFEEESYEIVMVFEGFGQIFRLLLLKSPYI
jgi:hypothetical protein